MIEALHKVRASKESCEPFRLALILQRVKPG